MTESDLTAIRKTLETLAKRFEDQFSMHRLESNRQHALIGEHARRLKEAEGGLFRDLQLPFVIGIAAIVDRLDAYEGTDNQVTESIRDELLELLALHDIHPVRSTGQFDPALHRAMRIDLQPDSPLGVILQVWARGYARGPWVFRHAQVVVNSAGQAISSELTSTKDHNE